MPIYLQVDKYAENDSLYPKDLQKRATVNQRLFFDVGILSAKMGAVAFAVFKEGAKSVSKDKADSLIQGKYFSILHFLLMKKILFDR